MTHSLDNIKLMWREEPRNFQTPCYLYSVSGVEKNFLTLKNLLGTNLVYSLKANHCVDLLVRCGHLFTDGIEVASVGELNLIAGGDGVKFINNPSMDKQTMRAAIGSKATIIIDNEQQLDMLGEFIGKRPLNPVLFRLNSCVLKTFMPEHESVRSDHFGMDWETAKRCLKWANDNNIEVQGFHLFKGSNTFVKTAMSSVTAVLKIIYEFEKSLGYPIKMINLGGGFDNQPELSDFDFDAYRNLLQEIPEHIEISHEAGRAIMASAGYFLTRVRSVKQIEDQSYIIADGGMKQNFLLAKTENSFRRYEEPMILTSNDYESDNDKETGTGKAYIVGTSCNRDDVIGAINNISVMPAVGDGLLFSHCGAYNESYTLGDFLSLPKAQAYIVE
ncbi:PLP-dependent decarboxylase [Pleionea sediminis]|uniref:PLP-dependent decarboxylase n=1 Tax=Pleionea sediminis TaxID=2569479 RepID=UPI001FE5F7B3|nr:PLP-dependent decarboxylase [Pleionea sediminis]